MAGRDVAEACYLARAVCAVNLKAAAHMADSGSRHLRDAVLAFLDIEASGGAGADPLEADALAPAPSRSSPPATAADGNGAGGVCSAACAAEFERCVRDVRAYATCRRQLDEPCDCALITSGGCIPRCADTPSMARLRQSSTGASTRDDRADARGDHTTRRWRARLTRRGRRGGT